MPGAGAGMLGAGAVIGTAGAGMPVAAAARGMGCCHGVSIARREVLSH